MNIAVLPARGGSKRITDKNIMPFAGRPMIGHALEAARESGLFDAIHVSTESDTIRETVEGLGFPVDFMRPTELADDVTGLAPVLRHVLEHYRDAGRDFETVCLIYPCAPLLEADDLKRGYEVFEKFDGNRDVMSVAEFPVPAEWAYSMDEDGLLTPRTPGGGAIRSQDLKKAYFDSASFAIFSAARVYAGLPDLDMNLAAVVLPKYRAVDIDEPEDVRLAEILYYGKRALDENGNG